MYAKPTLLLTGAPNFRDLGGYSNDEGRRVRWGQLFRSGHMSKLTDADQAAFTALGIRAACLACSARSSRLRNRPRAGLAAFQPFLLRNGVPLLVVI